MKKIFTLFLISTLFSSVFFFFWISSHDPEYLGNKSTEYKIDTVKPMTVQTTKTFTINNKSYIVSLGSDGHEYYDMLFTNSTYPVGSKYFHYPDCQKCNSKDSLILYYLKHNSNISEK